MYRKRKFGAFFILLGIGIPLVLFFFQDNGTMFKIELDKRASRKLTEEEIKWIENRLSELKEGGHWEEVRTSEELGFKEPAPIEKGKEKESYLIDWKKNFDDPRFKADFAIEAHGDRQFEEIWSIITHKTIDIPYMRFIGVGVFFMLIGIGLFTFSFFPKK